jgi:hypothetical protein
MNSSRRQIKRLRGERLWCLLATLAAVMSVSQAAETGGGFVCPVVRAPVPAFVPPAPFKPNMIDGYFLYGGPGLWALVTPHWDGFRANKLVYFRQGLDATAEQEPRMVVVARRLDKPAPLVWADLVNGIHMGAEGDFMNTSIRGLVPGCWEITARYFPARDNVQTLSYTVQMD